MKDEKILEKNKGIKTLVRFEAFILILVVFLAYLFTVFELNEAAKNTFETYYSEPKGTVDGVYIGASSTYRYFVPGLCYHDTGAAIFNLATAAQPYTKNPPASFQYRIRVLLSLQNANLYIHLKKPDR